MVKGSGKKKGSSRNQPLKNYIYSTILLLRFMIAYDRHFKYIIKIDSKAER